MSISNIAIEIPRDLLVSVNCSEKGLQEIIKTATAAFLFKNYKLTLGKAIQLSGLSRYEFENFLIKENIPINSISVADILTDIEKIKDK